LCLSDAASTAARRTLSKSSALLKSLKLLDYSRSDCRPIDANSVSSVNSVTSVNYVDSIHRLLGAWGKYVHRNLNWRLSIFSVLIRVSRVVGGTRSLTAAPDAPDTRPLLSASAASIISRSLGGSFFEASDVATRGVCEGILWESHNSSTEKTSVELRIMDLSITFCNSRILPGQS
jgi:hypothetical protein